MSFVALVFVFTGVFLLLLQGRLLVAGKGLMMALRGVLRALVRAFLGFRRGFLIYRAKRRVSRDQARWERRRTNALFRASNGVEFSRREREELRLPAWTGPFRSAHSIKSLLHYPEKIDYDG